VKTRVSTATVAGKSWRGIDGGLCARVDREQAMPFQARLEEYVAEDNPVRAVDAFVDRLDPDGLGFNHVQPLEIGRPGYEARMVAKLHLQSRAVEPAAERECQRNGRRNGLKSLLRAAPVTSLMPLH